ncbi:hypothetical protein [Haloarcula sp. Atlit-120R]|uniref:hypothetical protein n=1 Tax=Haloarcula sp. Atlit-120R TaxID=2282135 RepID=UPI000EF2047D|nr:hypothetical protein [Haloarcula sp. Atlit-120R]RLM32652.1 hypothetical protein DVK01_20485 [Haloarcula sp. Atlit-120R]
MSENTYEPDFDFEEGDTVLVRVRENGSIVVKFEATCTDISDPSGIGTSRKARFEMPFGVMNSVTICPYEAEFEVVEDD